MGPRGNWGVTKIVITLSPEITNHIFTQHDQSSCTREVRSVNKTLKTLNMRREPLWLLSLPWSLSASGGKSKPIFNSFVFNLGLISSIPLYLREAGWKVKPNHHRVTKLVYCLLLIPLHLSTRHFCHILPPMPKLKPTSVLATRHTICHNRLWIKLPWKRFSGWFISYFLFKYNFPENAKYSPSLSSQMTK